jgi:hypothetical protein
MAEIEAVGGAHFEGMRGLGVDLHHRPPAFDRFILCQKIETALGRRPVVGLSNKNENIGCERCGLALAPRIVSDNGLQTCARFVKGTTDTSSQITF